MIRTENISKSFGKVQALQQVNLHIQPGTVFGFIGPNGAGKSTMMQILATLMKPTSGRAWVGGYDVLTQADQVRKLIGYMPDFFGVYDRLTAMEYLEFYASAYGIAKEKRRPLALSLLELVNLADKQDEYVDNLSRGMKQRLGLARTLVHDPQLLILDEPASGLDPRARIEFRDVLKRLRTMGKTIMISSHILPELADLCDTIGLLENGKLVAYNTVAEITSPTKQGRIVEIGLLSEEAQARPWLERSELVRNVKIEEKKLVVELNGDENAQAQLLAEMVNQKFRILRFSEVTINMEDAFLRMTQEVEGGSADEATTGTAE